MRPIRFAPCLMVAAVVLLAVIADGQEPERRWEIQLSDFFRGGTKPVYLYARERDGQWIAVVGSSRDPDRQGGKTYNRSWYYGDLSSVPIQDEKMKGQFSLHMTPDLWVPRDHRGYTIVFEIDASLKGGDNLEGRYRVVTVGSKDVSTRDFGKGGRVTGTVQPHVQADVPEPVTFHCNMQGSLVGGDPAYGGRCMVLWLGLENGTLTSTMHGLLSQKLHTYSKTPFSYNGKAEGQSVRLGGKTSAITLNACEANASGSPV